MNEFIDNKSRIRAHSAIAIVSVIAVSYAIVQPGYSGRSIDVLVQNLLDFAPYIVISIFGVLSGMRLAARRIWLGYIAVGVAVVFYLGLFRMIVQRLH